MGKRIGVLLSGRGSNFEALADSVAAGRIPGAEIAVVVSNREGSPGIEKAKERKIATRVIPSKGLERETTGKLWRSCTSTKWIWCAWRDTCGCFRRFSWLRFRIAS